MSWREGTRVQFKPSRASLALYSRPPTPGTLGTVTYVNLGGTHRTSIPGPGGGIVYVKWDDGYTQGVSQLDVVKVSGRAAKASWQRLFENPWHCHKCGKSGSMCCEKSPR